MAISINWSTKVITVPQSDLTLVSGTLWELDVDLFRLALKDIEDSEEGVAFPDTHRHNTEVTLSGVTYARTFEIINGYTVSFENTGSPYTVRLAGANHNIADVTNYVSQVSLIVGNSAGLIAVGGASPWTTVIEAGFTAGELLRLLASIAVGKTIIVDNGDGTATVRFRDLADAKDRIVALMNGSQRTSVTRDAT